MTDEMNSLLELEERWIPDTLLNDTDALPSFVDIKKKIMKDLYEVDGNDKSPKGFVDVLIRPLVNLINIHPCFATLSSCSGRIALFDPHKKKEEQQDEDENEGDEEKEEPQNESTDTVEKSGKGRGAWLLSSHELVEPWTLVNLLDEQGGEASRETLIFKHEPLLLHVAASSLTRGRQLLALALQLGFRESGLTVTQRRVTVAIRSHSLALSVPLARQGPLRPSPAYLESLIKEANMRMQSNQDKLQRLYQTVQDTLFRPAKVVKEESVLTAAVTELPRLNLWGHAAVAVPVGTNNDVDVLVFGGFGQGPELEGSTPSTKSRKQCGRSHNVYSLRRRDGAFDDHWRHVRQKPVTQESRELPIMSSLGVEVVPVDFTARESLAACVLPTSSSAIMSVVALWGGRSSPGKPFDELLLYEPFAVSSVFVKPTTIRGNPPQARWGHTFTALSGSDGLMAVVVGGRNDKTTFGSLHILTLVKSDSSHFHWASLDFGLPPRFQHTTVSVDDSVFVFGGLDANDLLSSFAESFRSPESTTSPQPIVCGFHVDSTGVALLNEQDVGKGMLNLSGCIGGASCVVKTPNESGEITLIALTGGVSLNTSESIQWCEVVSIENDTRLALVPRNDIAIESGAEAIDFGSMVHHCCVSLPDCSDFVLVGGGVSSFAFGPSFAESHHVYLDLKIRYVKRISSRIRAKESPRIWPRAAPTKTSDYAKYDKTNVLYVSTADAKSLKTALEDVGFLDKKYRMTKAESGPSLKNAAGYIAVPITTECLATLEGDDEFPDWYNSFVVTTGKQEVPFSTAVLGQQKK